MYTIGAKYTKAVSAMIHIDTVHIEIEVAVVIWYHTRALWFPRRSGGACSAIQYDMPP